MSSMRDTDENMDIDFYEDLTKTFIKMKVKRVKNGQEIRTFYPSGKLKSVGIYKNGILNGDFKEYNDLRQRHGVPPRVGS